MHLIQLISSNLACFVMETDGNRNIQDILSRAWHLKAPFSIRKGRDVALCSIELDWAGLHFCQPYCERRKRLYIAIRQETENVQYHESYFDNAGQSLVCVSAARF